MSKQRMAGEGLLAWLQTPLGEEVAEGTAGGLMAGLPMFFQDNDPRQSALATGTAIAGGIVLGALGRRIGRHIGAAVHPEALANQEGMVALIGRTMGQETIGEAMAEQGRMMRSQVADYLVNNQATKMLQAGKISQVDLDAILGARKANGMLDAINNLPPERKQELMAAIEKDMARLQPLEDELVRGAAGSMDAQLLKTAQRLRDSDDDSMVSSHVAETLQAMTQGPAKPVTGAHVGQAIGRIAGDEVGVLLGLGGGMLLGQQLGFQSPKDVKIAKLEDQLKQGGKRTAQEQSRS